MALIRPNGNLHCRCDILINNGAKKIKHVLLTEAMDNGNIGIVTKADYATGQREVFNLTKPSTALITAKVAKEDIVIIKAPELVYDEQLAGNNALRQFYNTAGEVVRAYPLSAVEKFQVSEEGFNGTLPTIGQFVIIENGSWKLKASATLVDGATVGKLVRIDTIGAPTQLNSNGQLAPTYKMYVIEVL